MPFMLRARALLLIAMLVAMLTVLCRRCAPPLGYPQALFRPYGSRHASKLSAEGHAVVIPACAVMFQPHPPLPMLYVPHEVTIDAIGLPLRSRAPLG